MLAKPIHMNFSLDHGKLEINSEITEGLALETERALDLYFNYYQYSKVSLRLSSPGGCLTGLTHILQEVVKFRKQGKLVQTEATFMAASAAALLLSLGERGSRTVQPQTTLLYHHSRINGASSDITAGRADYLASALRCKDNGLLDKLVGHLVTSHGGVVEFASEGLARVELLKQNSAAIAQDLDAEELNRSHKWANAFATIYSDCAARNSKAVFQRHLQKRFEMDRPMDLREAYVLNLIDLVNGVPSLIANAQHKYTGVPKKRALKLAA